MESHRRAVHAQQAGYFSDELVRIDSGPDHSVIDRDEHPRSDTTIEKLAKLRPVMGDIDPEATVTAGGTDGTRTMQHRSVS